MVFVISLIMAAVKVTRTPQVTEVTLLSVSLVRVGFTGTSAFTKLRTGLSPARAPETVRLPLVVTLKPVSSSRTRVGSLRVRSIRCTHDTINDDDPLGSPLVSLTMAVGASVPSLPWSSVLAPCTERHRLQKSLISRSVWLNNMTSNMTLGMSSFAET